MRGPASNRRCAVFVGDPDEPKMVVPRLARSPRSGYLALRNFVPRTLSVEGPVTSFANVVIRPGDIPFEFASTPVEEERPEGAITEWQLSRAFDPGPGPVLQLPRDVLATRDWTAATADHTGLVVIGKHVARPQGVRRAAVLAKFQLKTERAVTVPFNLGYSDEVSVFLNEELLFSGDDSYSFDNPRRQGLIGLGQGTLYLRLRPGDNELVLAVTDVFGGWGVMGQLVERDGLQVSGGDAPGPSR